MSQLPVWAQQRRRRPNIILLLTDDQRADSLGCAGNPVLTTPNIDALASRGVRFTNAFATSAICMSSRASILTGLNTASHGIDNFESPLAPPLFAASYPMLLKQSGYRIGFVGKWGLGGPLPKAAYDYFAGYSGQGFYFEPGQPKHLTVRQGEQAVAFLRSTRRDQPFALQVSFKAPHVQDEGRNVPGIYPKYPYDRSLQSLYAQSVVPPPLTTDQTPQPALLDATLDRTREAPDFHPDNYQETMKALYRLLFGVDQAVGAIVQAVQEIGAADDTIIIYTSDHGSFYGEHGFGGKWLALEESIRSPLVYFDPSLPAERRGQTCDTTVLNIDIAPTLMELAGVTVPFNVQGRSILPLVRDQAAPPRHEWFYDHPFGQHHEVPIAPSQGIRTDRWKYVRYWQATPVCEQLFDLSADPREERDLVILGEQKPVLQQMRQHCDTWRATLAGAKPNQPWRDPI